MFQAILWGLVQGLTEFLPVSSSGHLVLVPAFLGLEPPDLATTAVLHLGTLGAVVAYYRRDVAWLMKFPRDPLARRVLTLLGVGTIPAVVAGLMFEGAIDRFQQSPTAVGVALVATGVVLFVAGRIRAGASELEKASSQDAVAIGAAQALALIPGISRSGMTIAAGFARGLTREQAARFAFLLALPVILGGGVLQAVDLAGTDGLRPQLAVGVLVAGISGYMAIAFLVRGLTRWGLTPFAYYCWLMGLAAIVML